MTKLLFTFLMILLTTTAYSQKYGINFEVDEFTSDSILVSDWIVLNDPVWKSGRISYVRVSKLDGQLVLQLKLTTGGDISRVEEGDKFYVKFENDDVMVFTNQSPVISSKGGGAIKLRGSSTEGVTLLFNITDEELATLSQNKISKIRVTTSSGNIEVEPEKEKYKKVMIDYFKFYKNFSDRY